MLFGSKHFSLLFYNIYSQEFILYHSGSDKEDEGKVIKLNFNFYEGFNKMLVKKVEAHRDVLLLHYNNGKKYEIQLEDLENRIEDISKENNKKKMDLSKDELDRRKKMIEEYEKKLNELRSSIGVS